MDTFEVNYEMTLYSRGTLEAWNLFEYMLFESVSECVDSVAIAVVNVGALGARKSTVIPTTL